MRSLGYALAAFAVLGAPLAVAQTRPVITQPLVTLPDPSTTSQQTYQHNEVVRQNTLRENAAGQQQVNTLYQQNQALRDQQSQRAEAPYHDEAPH